jgi:hypothetical protein
MYRRDGLLMCKVNATILKKQTQTVNKGWSSRLDCGGELGLKTHRCIKWNIVNCCAGSRN